MVGGLETHTKGTSSAQLRHLGTLKIFEIWSLGNGISRAFQEVFSTADAMLFHPNTRKTGNNAFEMSQAFQDIS